MRNRRIKYGLLLACGILVVLLQTLHGGDWPVTDYGAVGDGQTLNTEAIQKAIDSCGGDGGGRVVFPEGRFLSGTLKLGDGVELHLEKPPQ